MCVQTGDDAQASSNLPAYVLSQDRMPRRNGMCAHAGVHTCVMFASQSSELQSGLV